MYMGKKINGSKVKKINTGSILHFHFYDTEDFIKELFRFQ